jgi:hypothetical protein
MKEITKRDCAEVSKILKRRTGWIFSNIFRHYLADSALILQGEAENGEDIIFSVSDKWLLHNNPSRCGSCNGKGDFGTIIEFVHHTYNCESKECQEAMEWTTKMLEFIDENGKQLVRNNPLASICVLYQRKDETYDLLLSRENGCASFIEKIKPFIEWFTGKNKKLWRWPEEENKMFLGCHQKQDIN